jgi:hypothetical protein
MTRDFLAVSAADVKCERVFNTAKALYDHRKIYNSITFFAYMMMRFHDQKKNLQAKLDVDLSTKEKMTLENLNQEMKKRAKELQHVYHEHYISDNEDEDDILSNSSASRSSKIRSHNLILYSDIAAYLITNRKKRNVILMSNDSFLRNKKTQTKELFRHKYKLQRNRTCDYDNFYDNLHHDKFAKQCHFTHVIRTFL